ncbi:MULTISPECIES: YitT family protein [unclassified Enterococcus]|uniref:YitT family protein n=1 Tax=unclassified Enterococcus TaxID=2608891 RepID=UPI0013EA4D53|nr:MULTISPECIES: YitT family protein [unclassified Enterococcus]
MNRELKKLPILILGIFFIAIGLNWFLLPHDIASAGVGAIGHLLEAAFSIQRSAAVWTINLAMLVLAALLLGKAVFIKTVTGSLLFPVVLDLLPQTALVSSHLISLVTGSLLFSLGVYTLYTVGASNGGVTIPPIIFQKYFRLPVSLGLLLTNMSIVLLNFLVFGFIETLFVVLSISISSFFLKILVSLSPITREFDG